VGFGGAIDGGIDATTWQALGLVLTVVGLGISVVLWRRRGPAAGIRGVAWSLLPLAAGLTGTLRLLWEIGDAVGSWATRLVFSPVVWLGIVLAGVSAVLFVVASAMRRHGVGVRGRAAVSGAPDRSALSTGGPAATKAGGAAPTDDLADIEAILRKHGIS
jgi:hypothetical protein